MLIWESVLFLSKQVDGTIFSNEKKPVQNGEGCGLLFAFAELSSLGKKHFFKWCFS